MTDFKEGQIAIAQEDVPSLYNPTLMIRKGEKHPVFDIAKDPHWVTSVILFSDAIGIFPLTPFQIAR